MNTESGKITRNKWPESPGYDLRIEPSRRHITVSFAGQAIADTRDATALNEQGHGVVYYLPRSDVKMEFLRRTSHASHCPYKGHCSYYSIVVGDRTAENAVWSYENPYPEVAGIRELVAFYPDRVESIVVE